MTTNVEKKKENINSHVVFDKQKYLSKPGTQFPS